MFYWFQPSLQRFFFGIRRWMITSMKVIVNAKINRSYQSYTCCKKMENCVAISNHNFFLATNAFITNLILFKKLFRGFSVIYCKRILAFVFFENPWLKQLVLHQCGHVRFPLQWQLVNELLLNVVDKTKGKYVSIFSCTMCYMHSSF
jgi:hypothetical protein